MATQIGIKKFYFLPTEYKLEVMNVSQNKQWRLPSIHYVVCIVTGLPPLPKSVLHRLRSNTSSFKFLWPPSTCPCLLPRLPTHSISAPITCFRSKFLRKMWPTQLAFPRCIVHRLFLSSLSLCNTPFFTRSIQILFSILFHHHNIQWLALITEMENVYCAVLRGSLHTFRSLKG